MTKRIEFSRVHIATVARRLCFSMLAPFVLVAMSACDTNIGIRMIEKDSSSAFEVTGNEAVSWLWVRGPISPTPVREPPPIIWHIIPTNSNPLPSEIPPILFGTVPAGWQQEAPNGHRPALEEHSLYRATVVTTRNRSASLLFRVENGRAVEYTGQLP